MKTTIAPNKNRKYQWSKQYPACVRCGRNDRRHARFGWCVNCYSAQRYHDLKTLKKVIVAKQIEDGKIRVIVTYGDKEEIVIL